jgi:hypothetical protein
MHENANKRFEFSTLLSYLKIKSNFTEIDQEVVHHLKFLDRLWDPLHLQLENRFNHIDNLNDLLRPGVTNICR